MVFLLCCPGCSEEPVQTIKIGFVAGLTGKGSDLGVDGRDGALLAIEKINRLGGIKDANGKIRQLELITIDHGGLEERARESVSLFARQGVKVAIGPMISQMGLVMKPEADSHEVVLLSPTVSTEKLSGQDDFFFRIYPITDTTAPALANFAYQVSGKRRVSIVYDKSNAAFAESWIRTFSDAMGQLGGEIVTIHAIAPAGSMLSVAEDVVAKSPDGVLVIANSRDTGLFSQQLRKLTDEIEIYGTEWSTTKHIQMISGKSLEGACFISSFDDHSKSSNYLTFSKDFLRRYGVEATFASKFSYEAVMVLAEALRQNPDLNNIRASLKRMTAANGLQGDIRFDRFGDPRRDVYIKQLVDGHFRTIARWDGQSIQMFESD